MKVLLVRALGLVAALALVVPAGAAFAHPAAKGAAKPGKVLAAVKWKTGADSTFAGTRFDGEYDPDTNRIYFLGFRTTGDATDGSVWYYDVKAKTYTDTGVDMPVPVSNYQIAALTDKKGLGFYIFGGRDANAQIVTTTQVYYPATDTASIVKTDPWPGTTPSGCPSLPAMGVATLGNKAYVLGGLAFSANGCVGDENSAQTWVFDPGAKKKKRWSQGPDLTLARGYITPAVLDGKIYAIGGDINDAANLVPVSVVEVWAPPKGKWSDKKVADLPEACDESQAFGFTSGVLASSLVLAGCGQWPNALPDALQYDVAGDSWSIVGALNQIRRNQAGALVGSGKKAKMYILGGYDDLSGFQDPTVILELGSGSKKIDASPRRAPSRASRGVATS